MSDFDAASQEVAPLPSVHVAITQFKVTTSLVEVRIGRYGSLTDDSQAHWHVEGTPPDAEYRSSDEAMAVASHLARRLHRAMELRREARAIEEAAPTWAMSGRAEGPRTERGVA